MAHSHYAGHRLEEPVTKSPPLTNRHHWESFLGNDFCLFLQSLPPNDFADVRIINFFTSEGNIFIHIFWIIEYPKAVWKMKRF
jgi:hypothetical protein